MQGTISFARPVMDFTGNSGIGQERTSKADEVGPAVADDLFGKAGVVDAVAGDDGPGDGGLHAACKMYEGTSRHVHGDLGQHGLVPPPRDTEGVNPVLLEHVGKLGGLLVGVAACHEIVSGDTENHGVAGPDGLTDCPGHLDAEAHAPVGAPAVLVGPLVGQRREELRDQVACARKNLDGVEAGLLCPDGGLREVGNGVLNIVEGHFPGDFPGDGRSDRGGCDGLPADHAGADVAASMEELGGNEGAVAVHGVRDLFQAGDEAVVAQADHLFHAACVLIDRAAPDEDQRRAAACALLVEGHETVRHLALVVAVAEVHGRHDDAVLECKRPYLDRRKKMLHDGSPFSLPFASPFHKGGSRGICVFRKVIPAEAGIH